MADARDRAVLRSALGWRYDGHARTVTRMLSERPGLRVTGGEVDGLVTELVAVSAFVTGGRRAIDTVRAAGPAALATFLRCVTGGLRRLPACQGVVLCAAPDGAATLDRYAELTGAVVEPDAVAATADLAADLAGATEIVIWSTTARRLEGLVPGDRRAEVVLPPGTALEVLGLDRDAGRVFLSTRSGGQAPDDAELLSRLTAIAAHRDAPDHPAPTAVPLDHITATPGLPRAGTNEPSDPPTRSGDSE